MSIVNSQLVVNAYNDSLWLSINGGATQVVTMLTGNYDALTLSAALNLRTAALYGVSWSYDSTTLRMTATCPGGGVLRLGGSLCVQLLDIPEGSIGTSSVSSARTVRLTGVQSILVDTDLSGQNVTLRAAGAASTTLARVCNDAEPLATLHFQSAESGNLLYETSIYNFSVSLTDEYGRALLVTCPYEMSLEFKPVYTGRVSFAVPRPFGLAAFSSPDTWAAGSDQAAGIRAAGSDQAAGIRAAGSEPGQTTQ